MEAERMNKSYIALSGHLCICWIILMVIFLLPNSAHAYIDPGSGSYVLQIILASLLGGIFYIKTIWRKIRSLLSNLFAKKDDAEK